MKYDIKNLTLDEKLTLLTGKDFWHNEGLNGKLKEICMHDGPSGLRMVEEDTDKEKTAMPTLSVLANTWNKDLAYLDGQTIADDCVESNVDIILAPGVNVKRTPLNGRNFEYFSEDPFLAGTLAYEFIKGVQDKGIGTSLKHYCTNNREKDRLFQTSEVDDRALHEIYLKPFEIALKADPWTVMCSYNPINGVYASENKKMLSHQLRDVFGFKNLIMSDWGAVHNHYKCVKASLDLDMPHDDSFENLKTAYNNGFITDEEIDFCVNNILNLIEKTENDNKKITFTKKERHENAVKIAKEGIVLLKNNGILPLNNKKITVLGDLSVNPAIGGGGSSCVISGYKQKSLTELLNENSGIKAIYPERMRLNNWQIEAEKLGLYSAYGSDAVIICVSPEFPTEGGDLDSIKLCSTYEKVIHDVKRFNENIIVCVFAGSAVDMSSFINDVSAVIYCGLAGEGVNEALTDIIVGKTIPSGKITETFPMSIEDTFTKSDCGNGLTEWYNDGIFVGYRYYEKEKKNVLFPFGFGLSYAEFEYSDLKITKKSETDIQLEYVIKNNSDFDAKEISQVYVKDVFSMVNRPEKELKGFSKDLIKAHGSKKVKVDLDYSSFAYYCTALDGWHVENGVFEILVGSSSSDIKLIGKIEINLPDNTQQSQY